MQGIIIKAIAGFYYVEASNEVYECKARGLFRKNGVTPLVGDRVEYSYVKDQGIIEEVLERKNSLIRPPLANIDKLLIISSYTTPQPSTLQIDRMTAIAESKGIEPIIVFNKSDLGDFSSFRECYEKTGYKTCIISAETGEGIQEIMNMLGGIAVLTGNSGVGKSSIINKIIPQLFLKTGEVSEKLGRGRHTTRHVELFSIGSGYIADTPGFSSIDIERYERLLKEDLPYCFKDFSDHIKNCQFTSCSHTKEKGCGVLKAVIDGTIAKSRHDSYVTLYNEVKEIKQWQLKK